MKRGLKQVGEFGAPPGCWRGQCHKRGGARRLLKGRVAMEGGGGPPRICQKERERERRIKMSLCGCDREGEGGISIQAIEAVTPLLFMRGDS